MDLYPLPELYTLERNLKLQKTNGYLKSFNE